VLDATERATLSCRSRGGNWPSARRYSWGPAQTLWPAPGQRFACRIPARPEPAGKRRQEERLAQRSWYGQLWPAHRAAADSSRNGGGILVWQGSSRRQPSRPAKFQLTDHGPLGSSAAQAGADLAGAIALDLAVLDDSPEAAGLRCSQPEAATAQPPGAQGISPATSPAAPLQPAMISRTSEDKPAAASRGSSRRFDQAVRTIQVRHGF